MNKYLVESLKFLQGLEEGQVKYLVIGGVDTRMAKGFICVHLAYLR